MVGRGGRGVDRAEAVDEHRDALARKAAQHRARSVGREAGRRYARLAGQAIADLAANILRPLLALQPRYIAEDVEAAEIGRGDDDRLIGVKIILAVPALAVISAERRVGEE